MTAPLRLLIAHSPRQQAIFAIAPEQMAAALARCPLPLPEVEVDFCKIDAPDFAARMERADAMMGWEFPRDLVAASRGRLNLIQMTGAGVEHLLPFDWIPGHIALATASGIHAAKVEEWAVMVLLMLHGHIPHFATAQRAGQWSKRHSSTIAGKTALIYGTGGIGGAVARAAARLGVHAIGVRRTPEAVPGFDRVIGQAQAGEALAEADFVVLATPLTPQTRNMADAGFFGRMRPDAGFANFGRGGLVVQEALIAALEQDRLGGAVVDVTTPEPLPPDSTLWQAPRLLITPHVSCDDPVTYVPLALDIFLDNVHRRLTGQPVRNLVDRSRAY